MLVALITPDRVYHPFVTMMIEGLRERGDTFFASDPGNGLSGPSEVFEEAGWLAAAEHADAVLVFFGKEGSHAAGAPPTRAPKYELLDAFDERGTEQPVAYLDYSEMTATGQPMPGQVARMKRYPEERCGRPWFNEWALESAAYYFKRECFPEDESVAGARPIAFGMLAAYDVPVPRQGKDWDLLCCFGHTETGLRAELVKECQKLKGKWRNRTIQIRERLSPREYRDALARSKIVVDAWGHGDHCYRLWEGAGAKACMIYQQYQVLTGPDWFEEGREAVSFSTIKEFKEKVEALLEDREGTMAIGRRGYEKAVARHMGKHRIEYVFRTMGLL